MKFIELFAGCGGLSLGLKAAGGEMVFANELSPMAAETYAFNFFNEDWTSGNLPKKTKWLSSSFSLDSFQNRLRENPYNFQFPSVNCDIKDASDLKGNLIVGNIKHLNRLIDSSKLFKESFIIAYGDGQVDLVSGGPPCQSFSMAGMRELSNERNNLPWEFAKFVGIVRPKIVLLENVQGILNAFIDGGVKYHAWFEVCKAFAKIDYIPVCFLVNAKFVGVPQNRPRFIMIGISSVYKDKLLNSNLSKVFESSIQFFQSFKSGNNPTYNQLKVYDTSNITHQSDLSGTLFEILFSKKPLSVKDAIDDLSDIHSNDSGAPWIIGKYAKNLNKIFKKTIPERFTANTEFRFNSPRVRKRFWIYQLINTVQIEESRLLRAILKGTSVDIKLESFKNLLKHEYLSEDGLSWVRFNSPSKLHNYLFELKTKKQTQRALNEKQPAPATLSIPDDACHYKELRTLTVREMARIQSFPDNFEFRSKITTGGTSRRFEVPQYTQVGNAVPPLLGLALGSVCKALLDEIKASK
jgi:DNA (cytosine-5)-methyltransferase 1